MSWRAAAKVPRRGIPAFSVLLIMAALTVIGAAMLPLLNIRYTPSPSERKIDVSFYWHDASARLVEQSATSRIEAALSTVSGCERVSSRSSKGSGGVTVWFRKGTDMEAARFEVSSAIRNLYAKLPPQLSYPVISDFSAGGREPETLIYTIKADLPSERLEKYVSAYVQPPLSRLKGVGSVSLSGVTPFEWVITFDPNALEASGITADHLAKAFTDYFRNDIIGMTTQPHTDGTERSIILKLANKGSLDFSEIPVVRQAGRIYYLRDFATVRWREAEPAYYFRINGLNTINLAVTCESHTNMLRVNETVREEMARLQRFFPPEISATLIYDASEYITGELHKIYLRTLLCVLILLLFVYAVSRDPRYLLIIATTLLVNILIAVVFYNLLDLNIHIYTLAGITVSLGVIIDTSIIMVDHYSYYHDRKILVSIVGALLTTIGALTIVWLLPEQQRMNLTDFSLVIVINLTVSLLVAVLFIPALLDRFPLKRSMTVVSMRQRRFAVGFSRLYGGFIAWGRRHKWIFIAALVWGFGIPTYLLPDKIEERPGQPLSWTARRYNDIMESRFVRDNRQTIDRVLGSSLYRFNTSTERYAFYREPAQKVLYVNAGMPEGCTVRQLNEVVRHMENYIARYDQVEMFRTHIYSYDYAQIEITFKPEAENTSFPAILKQELTAAAINFGGATWRIWGIDDNSFNNNVVNSYKPNQIYLYGYNYDQLSAYAERMIDSLSRNRRVSQPEIMDGNAWTLPHNEFDIRYDKERIAAGGHDITDYYRMLNSMLYSRELPPVYDGGELQRVVMESAEAKRFDRWHILNAAVSVNAKPMKLAAIGSIEKQRSGVSIYRDRQSYLIIVGFDFIGSYQLCRRLIDRTVEEFSERILPLGFKTDSPVFSPAAKEKKDRFLLILLVIAIIYTMCSIIFESLRKPLVVILMIPISFIGVFLVFGLTDFTFDQGGFAAFVLLCGIVVNAGIYLINEAENCAKISRKQGIALYLKAYNHKIIPISLTIVSTILGLIPFLWDGPDEVFWFAFSVAAISGTLFSVIALTIYLPIFLPLHGEKR